MIDIIDIIDISVKFWSILPGPNTEMQMFHKLFRFECVDDQSLLDQ